jgi:hypothetical protein
LDAASRTPSKDVLKELKELQKQLKQAREEANKSRSEEAKRRSEEKHLALAEGSSATLPPGELDAAAAQPRLSHPPQTLLLAPLLGQYALAVEKLCEEAAPPCASAEADCEAMSAAVGRVAGYFGEDPTKCESESVFSALRQFIEAFKLSKDKVGSRRLL